MDNRVLGKSGIKVSPLGMGCMGITHASGDPMPDDEAVSVVRQAHEMGYTFFDTAECYVGTCADGTEAHNEDVVGKALAPVRDEVVIATKFGVTHAPDKTILVDSRPEVIRISVEKSLRRLRTDHIDLYYQHRIDPKVEPRSLQAPWQTSSRKARSAPGESPRRRRSTCVAPMRCAPSPPSRTATP